MRSANTRFLRRAALCTLALILLSAASVSAEQPRFYLSTSRVFTPQDSRVEVQLEARGLSKVDFRLYRIGDPIAFFEAQQDLHRVETQNGPKRA
jgi:hypothetical protein